MDTIPDPFSLCNPPESQPPKQPGFRVPFGLRDGRTWAPSEVGRGKDCLCICPGCLAPLVAKAQTSRRKRPHFAHLTDAGCQTGRETGIHLRAKQLIAERQELLVPAWIGDMLDMPNPPNARDDEGQLHWGRKVDHPARVTALREVEVERSFGAYQPDAYALDESGELLIEIRVTHAVDDHKAARVQAQGRRMVEIDLSRLDRDTPHDLKAFERAVLFDPNNRSWISCPEAVADWESSKRDLDEQVSARNARIAKAREQFSRATKERLEREARDSRDKAERRNYVRKLERAKHAKDLSHLLELTAPARVEQLLREYQASAEAIVSERLAVVPPAARFACLRAHRDGWIFGVDPALWQLLAYDHFVGNRSPGDRFNQRDVATWIRQSFPYERGLYRLFATQYGKRAEARRAGFSKRKLNYWVFTDEENDRIPDFYAPINELIDRLAAARLIRHLPAPIGECEVCKPPSHGHFPVAAIDAGSSAATATP